MSGLRPRVSVVVPAYNSAAYLDECLGSLEAQTLGALQVILVDDGSTDDTLRMMQQRAEANPGRFTVLTKENGGQATARNLGLKHCTGEYVGFLDSDDYADADMFRRMYDKAVRADADLVSCGFVGFRDEPDNHRAFDKRMQLPVKDRTLEDLYRTPQVQPWIHLIQRDVLQARGIAFPELRAYEDIAFHLVAIADVRRIASVSCPLVKRRWRKKSTVSTLTKEQVLQALPSLEYAARFYAQYVPSSERRQLLELTSLRLLLCSTLGRANLLPDFHDRATAVSEIFAFIDRWYSHRKNNPKLTGPMGSYLKNADMQTASVTGPLFAARQKRIAHL